VESIPTNEGKLRWYLTPQQLQLMTW
jgi:hypothetical protein